MQPVSGPTRRDAQEWTRPHLHASWDQIHGTFVTRKPQRRKYPHYWEREKVPIYQEELVTRQDCHGEEDVEKSHIGNVNPRLGRYFIESKAQNWEKLYWEGCLVVVCSFIYYLYTLLDLSWDAPTFGNPEVKYWPGSKSHHENFLWFRFICSPAHICFQETRCFDKLWKQ